jgi:hypothetical protein
MNFLQIRARCSLRMLLFDYEAAIAAHVSRYAEISRVRERTRDVPSACSREEASLKIEAKINKGRKVEVCVHLRKRIPVAKNRQRDTGIAKGIAMVYTAAELHLAVNVPWSKLSSIFIDKGRPNLP